MAFPVGEVVRGLRINPSEEAGKFEVEWIAKRGPDSMRNIVILIQNTTLPVCQRLMGLALETANWENVVLPKYGMRPLDAFDHKTMVRIEHVLHLVVLENNLGEELLIVGKDEEALTHHRNMLKEDPR